jgi:hypothetical protein
MGKIIALAFMLVLIAQTNLFAMSADDFTNLLTSHAWKGSQRPANYNPNSNWKGGDLEIEFTMADGKWTGKIVRATGTSWPMDGTPLSDIKVNVESSKPVVTFKSATGTSFYLAYENGRLTGEAWAGSNTNIVTLASVDK